MAIYLLDVSGHGVGSALLSVSVLNILRSQSLPNTNFCQPNEVLKALNNAFQMNNHGDKYFTIWYGVYNRLKRQLIYASAGHPPAILRDLPERFGDFRVVHTRFSRWGKSGVWQRVFEALAFISRQRVCDD